VIILRIIFLTETRCVLCEIPNEFVYIKRECFYFGLQSIRYKVVDLTNCGCSVPMQYLKTEIESASHFWAVTSQKSPMDCDNVSCSARPLELDMFTQAVGYMRVAVLSLWTNRVRKTLSVSHQLMNRQTGFWDFYTLTFWRRYHFLNFSTPCI